MKMVIKKSHLDASNNYVGPSIPSHDCDLIIDPHLGLVKFQSLVVGGRIEVGIGSGIKSKTFLTVSGDLVVRGSCCAGFGISAGSIDVAGCLHSGMDIVCYGPMVVIGSVVAKRAVIAEYGITVGGDIRCAGLRSGFGISARHLHVGGNIFAGVSVYRALEPTEMRICADVRSGTVCYGSLSERE